MVELIATAIITISSTLLFGYWLRSAVLLLREQCVPLAAPMTSTDNPSVLINSPLPIKSTAAIS